MGSTPLRFRPSCRRPVRIQLGASSHKEHQLQNLPQNLRRRGPRPRCGAKNSLRRRPSSAQLRGRPPGTTPGVHCLRAFSGQGRLMRPGPSFDLPHRLAGWGCCCTPAAAAAGVVAVGAVLLCSFLRATSFSRRQVRCLECRQISRPFRPFWQVASILMGSQVPALLLQDVRSRL